MSEKNKKALDSESIQKIAAQVEKSIRQSAVAAGSDGGKASEKGRTGNSRFFWGALSGVVVAAVAPLLGKPLRPVIRGAIKGGIASGRYIRKVAEGVREDLQD